MLDNHIRPCYLTSNRKEKLMLNIIILDLISIIIILVVGILIGYREAGMVMA